MKTPPRVWASIDPGLQGTGWAYWHGAKLESVGILTAPKTEKEWWERAHWIAKRIGGLCAICSVVYVEHMEYFGGSQGMAWKTGDLQRTEFLIGAIAGRFDTGIVIPVPVREWKGQLPKTVVTQRIQEALGADRCTELGITSHAWDAVGIGLWAQHRL